MADAFVLLVLCLLGVYVASFIRAFRDRRAACQARRDSLWQDPQTGRYHWTTQAGRPKSSDIHPDEPGGDWYEEELEAIDRLRS